MMFAYASRVRSKTSLSRAATTFAVAGHVAEERQLSDGFAGTDFRDRAGAAVERHEEAPGEHDIELVGRVALADEHGPAPNAQLYGLLLEPLPVLFGQLCQPGTEAKASGVGSSVLFLSKIPGPPET